MTIFLPLLPAERVFRPLREPVEREARAGRSLPMVDGESRGMVEKVGM